MNTKKYLFATLAFIIVGFLIAYVWHLVIFESIYTTLKIYTIEPIIYLGFILAYLWHLVIFKSIYEALKIYSIEPILALGFISFILEGLAFVFIFTYFRRGKKPAQEGLIYGLVV